MTGPDILWATVTLVALTIGYAVGLVEGRSARAGDPIEPLPHDARRHD